MGRALTSAACGGAALCFMYFAVGCAVGRNHTSDWKLEQTFHEHEAEFEALLAEVQADTNLQTIQPHALIYAGHLINVLDDLSTVESLGLKRDRWLAYQKQLRKLGLAGGVLKSEGQIEFRVDPGSIFNGDSYKGYLCFHDPVISVGPTLIPPQHIKFSLDDYRIADSEKDNSGWSVYKPLKGHWYLYLFVNR